METTIKELDALKRTFESYNVKKIHNLDGSTNTLKQLTDLIYNIVEKKELGIAEETNTPEICDVIENIACLCLYNYKERRFDYVNSRVFINSFVFNVSYYYFARKENIGKQNFK